MKSDLEQEYLYNVKVAGLPIPERQSKIIPGRKFEFDFVWHKERLAVEIQGSTWVANTGHSSGSGIRRDCEKHNLAVLLGWRVLMFTADMVHDGIALDMTERALK